MNPPSETRSSVQFTPNFSPEMFFLRKYGEFPNIFSVQAFDGKISKYFDKYTILVQFRSSDETIYISSSEYGGGVGNVSLSSNSTSYYNKYSRVIEISDGFWAFYGNRAHCTNFYYTNAKRKEAEKYIAALQKKFPYVVQKDHIEKIYLLLSNEHGFYVSGYPVKKNVNTDLRLNYGAEFPPIYEKLVKSLTSETNGLYIMNSVPGAGKTSLIKHLINNVPGQKVLFLPPNQTGALGDPKFIPFLIKQEIDLLVIEDAELILKSREENASAYSSTILNLTDGIMGDILGIKILATFNTSISSIDPAFLRKGRLRFSHEFGPLSVADANLLLEHLGKTPQDKSMTLAEIYNQDDTGLITKDRGSMNLFGQYSN